MLDDGNARNAGGDRLELAANLGRRFRLHVEGINLARPAIEIEEDARLGSAFGLAGGLEPRFLLQQLRQCQAKDGTGADLEKVSARQLAGASHRHTPWWERRG